MTPDQPRKGPLQDYVKNRPRQLTYDLRNPVGVRASYNISLPAGYHRHQFAAASGFFESGSKRGLCSPGDLRVTPVLGWVGYRNDFGPPTEATNEVRVQGQQSPNLGALDFSDDVTVTRVWVIVHVAVCHALHAPSMRNRQDSGEISSS